jgi:hypothetical protein
MIQWQFDTSSKILSISSTPTVMERQKYDTGDEFQFKFTHKRAGASFEHIRC